MAEIKQLETFVQVIDCGSFTKAATKLGISPPAVSMTIANLESSLGVRLINRSTRNLQMTSEGRDLYEKSCVLIQQFTDTITSIREAANKPNGIVRVSVNAIFGRYFLIPTLAPFFDRYPNVELDIDFDDEPKDLLACGFDVGIRQGEGNHLSYVSRVLAKEYPIIMVASPAYLMLKGNPSSIEELSSMGYIGAGFMTPSANNWQIQRNDWKREKITIGKSHTYTVPTGQLTLNTQIDTGLAAALNDLGIAPVALPAALPYLESGHLKVVMPEYSMRNVTATGNQIFIQYPHREYLPLKVSVFVEYLLDVFRNQKSRDIDLTLYTL